jgi:CheY-like chemotaxis protein
MSVESGNRPHKSVLLVDDDLDDRELFVEAFGDIDKRVEVKTLDESEGLLNHLSQLQILPDYLFLDLNMPKKSGKECLKEIQNNERLRHIKIVIYSTSINPKDVAETHQHGAYCFIQKPNSFSDLKQLLKQVIDSGSTSYAQKDAFVISSSKI